MDAASVLREMWDGTAYEDDEYDWDEEEEDEEMVAMRAPFSRQFPGLAAAESTSLSQDEIQKVLTSLRPARLGLVPASRPADVLPSIGWSGFVLLARTQRCLLPLSCAPGKTGSAPGSWTWDSLRSCSL